MLSCLLDLQMTKALWHIDADHSSLKEVEKPLDSTNLLEVKAKYSLISTGTERLVSLGNVDPKLEKFMAVPYMDGRFSLPVKYGYSLVGEVQTQGEYQGKMVHLMHPHQSTCWVKENEVTVLPENLDIRKAPLISNVETVVNAIWDSEASLGDEVLIAGFGNIGVLLAETLRHIPGINIYILELNEWRRQQAIAAGFLLADSSLNPVDIAFDTTAAAGGLQACIQAVKEEGKVINLSWYGSKSISLNLGTDFHYGRKQIISSQVSKIPNNKKEAWSYAKRKALVMDILEQYPFENYITSFVPFGESPDFYQKLRKGQQGDGLIWCIEY